MEEKIKLGESSTSLPMIDITKRTTITGMLQATVVFCILNRQLPPILRPHGQHHLLNVWMVLICYVERCSSDSTIQTRIQEINDGDIFKAGLTLRFNSGPRICYALLIDSFNNTIEISKVRGALGDACNEYGGIYYEPIQYTKLCQSDISSSLFDDCQLKFKAEGQYLYGKVWATGTSEPASWNIDIEDLDYAVNYGNGGVIIINNPDTGNYAAQAAFDDVIYTTDEPEPPEVTKIALEVPNLEAT